MSAETTWEPPAAAASDVASVARPKPLRRPAVVLLGVLGLSILVDGVALVLELDQYHLLEDLSAGVDVSLERAQASDQRVGASYLAQAVLSIVAAIAWLVWFRRAYRNLPGIGVHHLRYRPGWAVGAWFVPILAIWRPKQIANDIWRGSDAFHGRDAVAEQGPLLFGWLTVWWTLWLLASLFGRLDDRIAGGGATIEDQLSSSAFGMVADVIYILAAIAAIVVVRAISERQDYTIAEHERDTSASGMDR